jgi:uncharacterized protein YdeI (YjbR/CyaY-like superfamily)
MAKTAGRNPQVDAYIAKAAPFAQPILRHLRDVIHEGAPGVVEQMKWSRPFFALQGVNGEVILGNISAFQQHCSFGLWGTEIAQRLRADGVASSEGMGTFGKIASVDDLPARAKLLGYVKEAAQKIATGERTKAYSRPRVAKAEPEVPAELAAALTKNKAAAKIFAAKGPGCRREYCAWIAGAKREETRAKRVSQAIAQIAEGKNLNWKYEKSN